MRLQDVLRNESDHVITLSPTASELMSVDVPTAVMNSEAGGLARLTALPRPCRPLDGALDASLTLCERLANRVAAFEKTWGVIIGSEPLLAAWAVLHGLAQAGRARTYGAVTSSPAAPPCLRFAWRPVQGARPGSPQAA